jgi:predicted dehydrogenase
MHYRMNAGYFPHDHWVHEAGGRIVGEACHMIDFATSLTGSRVVSFSIEELTPTTNRFITADNKSFLLKYEDGSMASFQYFATGHPGLSKEYVEIHFDGKTIVLDDYRTLKGWGLKLREIASPKSEKGHLEEMQILHQALTKPGESWPIPFWDMLQTTEMALRLTGVGDLEG